MNEISRPRLLLGLVLWVALLGVVGVALLSPDGAARAPAERVIRFATEGPRRLEMIVPAGTSVWAGDPVLVRDPQAFLVQIGHVVTTFEEDGRTVARLRIHADRADLLREGLEAEVFTVPKSAAWIVTTLLPPERLHDIRERTRAFLDTHGEAIGDALWPEVRTAILEVLAHAERELPAALAAQSERWAEFFRRHRDGVLGEKLVPALQEVTLVLARERFGPLIEEVGAELWDALPAWSIGWRYVWQQVPFTTPDQAKRRFDRYLEEDATPILTAHADDAARLAGEVVRDSLKDERVRTALAEVVRTMGSDPELGRMLVELLNGVFLKNEAMARLVRERWQGGLGQAVRGVLERSEPLVKDIVNAIVLDDERKKIDPRLSRVLRCRVLMKDGRWVLLAPGDGPSLADGARVEGSIHDE